MDSISISIDTTAPYEGTAPNLAPGIYTFSAVARDNLGATTTSAAIQARVASEAQITFITQNGATYSIAASATTGISYELEATTDFVNWSAAGAQTATAGSVTFADTPTQTMRFYRIVAR